MAGIEPLISTDQLKTTRLAKLAVDGSHHPAPTVKYDGNFDALFILFVQPEEETVVHYVDDYVAFICEAESLEIIGLQIEAFERAFLPKHATLERTWRLSDSGVKVTNFGDLTLAVQQMQPRLVKEVVKSTHSALGTRADIFRAVAA
jgi:hypothetical protein